MGEQIDKRNVTDVEIIVRQGREGIKIKKFNMTLYLANHSLHTAPEHFEPIDNEALIFLSHSSSRVLSIGQYCGVISTVD